MGSQRMQTGRVSDQNSAIELSLLDSKTREPGTNGSSDAFISCLKASRRAFGRDQLYVGKG